MEQETAKDIIIKLNEMIPEYNGKFINLFIWIDKLIHVGDGVFETKHDAVKMKGQFGIAYFKTIEIKETIEETIAQIHLNPLTS